MADDDLSKSPASSELNNSQSNDNDSSDGSSQNEANTNGANQPSRCFLRPSVLQAQTSKFSSGKTTFGNSGLGSKPFGFSNNFGHATLFPGKSSDSTNGNHNRPNPFARTPSASDAASGSQDQQTFELLRRNENPDLGNNTAGVQNSPSVGNSNFVFGQNMLSRIANANQNATQHVENGDKPSNLTFTPSAVPNPTGDSSASKSLEESAQEYEQRQVKRTYDEVEVVTGEEDESNVLQIASKLHTFDKATSTWTERGRGFLRLNDKMVDGTVHSRVVMRTHGSLRVILNFQVWAGMTIEKPSEKTIRFTACEPEGIKVYLVTANPKDIEQLHSALEWRETVLQRKSGDSQQPGQCTASVKRAKLEYHPESQKDSSSNETDENAPPGPDDTETDT